MTNGLDISEILQAPFVSWGEMIALQAKARPDAIALVDGEAQCTYGALDALVHRAAASLAREGLRPGDAVAICAETSIAYCAAFIGAVRAGVAAAPLPPGFPEAVVMSMARDSGAKVFFFDRSTAALTRALQELRCVALDDFEAWLTPPGTRFAPPQLSGAQACNIIYSSGTTGVPKGIVQSHAMRWTHIRRGAAQNYGPDAVTMISTPLYSNTTLVSLIASLALGAKVVLMRRFKAADFLKLAQTHRATHAMLVPVQYQRLMDEPTFDDFNLSSFQAKFCTSAPFPAALKAEVVRRWPGALLESYGMTEGGGVCFLPAHERPDKLHTVGQPALGHDIRLIDENGRELPLGETGEVVGHSAAMMSGYLNRPAESAAAFWTAPNGKRFIRTGDIGRFDADGFLILVDRKKDMINSGGFNVYPSDLEAALRTHPAVAEAAVIGAPSREWGETPVALVTLAEGAAISANVLRAWLNERLGKTQRVSALEILESLPRSEIGKVLKRDLRDRWLKNQAPQP